MAKEAAAPAALSLHQASGKVVDALSGEPIAGASLRWCEQGAQWVEVKSSANGRFVLQSAVLEQWRLEVAADAYATRVATVTQDRYAEIALTPGRRCQGRIVDRATGAAVRGATLFATEGILIPVDEVGEFTVFLAPLQRRTFVFSGPGFCSLLVELEPEEWLDPVSTFPLQREAVLAGVVTDEAGTPLEARLTLQGEGPPEIPQSERSRLGLPGLARDVSVHGGYASGGIHAMTASSPDGHFRMPGLPPVETACSLRAVASGYLQGSPDSVTLPAPGTTEIHVILRPGAFLTVVASENGKRWGAGSLSWKSATQDGTLTPSHKGEGIEFEGTVEAGLVRLQALDSHGTVKHSLELELEAGEERQVELAWEDARQTIRGMVLQANGAAAASAVVRAYAQVGTSDEPVSLGGGKTDASGRFEFSVPAADTYELRALLGTASASEKGVLPGSEVVLRLPAMGSFRARFVDALTGELRDPGNGFYWRPPGQERFQKVPHWSVSGRHFPPGGDFEFRLPEGTIDFRLVLRDERFPLITLESVEVTTAPGAPITVRIGPGCDLFLSLRGLRDVEELRTRALVLLRDDQVERVHEVGDGDDAAFEVDDDDTVQKEIVRQMLDVNGSGEALVRGLRPGRYTIRAFPADVAFTPQWFEVPDVPEYRQAVEWQ